MSVNVPIVPGITLVMDSKGTRTQTLTVEETLPKLGYALERSEWGFRANYAGIKGGFSTPWRATEAEVLADVQKIKCAENAAAVGEQKARWK
jgi:hypothetical protein